MWQRAVTPDCPSCRVMSIDLAYDRVRLEATTFQMLSSLCMDSLIFRIDGREELERGLARIKKLFAFLKRGADPWI